MEPIGIVGLPGIKVQFVYHCERQPTLFSSPSGGFAPVQPAARQPQLVSELWPSPFTHGASGLSPFMPYVPSLRRSAACDESAAKQSAGAKKTHGSSQVGGWFMAKCALAGTASAMRAATVATTWS